MSAIWKLAVWVGGALMLSVVASVVYVENRGGHYPIHEASSFANLNQPAAGVAPTDDVLVRTAAGALHGMTIGRTVAFRGIPYARPPVGELRWKPPLPPMPWEGVREAVQPGTACTQRISGLTPFFEPMAQAYGSHLEQPSISSSEDCLYLDVWLPEWPVKRALPVMVWLHGGSNMVGSGTQSSYDGASLTRRGVLLVTLNYRLGVMGFFSHPELTAESPHHSSGNYGLLDQLAALDWVKKNIAQFGGDPDNVTLFGESAGAVDAGRLMTSPLAAGLFKHVISESGPVFGPARTLQQAEAFGSAVSAWVPDHPGSTALEKLRALPAADIDALVAKVKDHFPVDITAATADGWVLPASPQEAFVTGAFQKVDLLIGLNGREFSAFRLAAAAEAKASGSHDNSTDSGGLKKFSDAARPCFGSWTPLVIGGYLARILVNRNAGLDAAFNDLVGACPIGAMASLANAAGQRVFVYRFDRVIPGTGAAELGAFHSLEVPYVFGSLHDREWQWLPSTVQDTALSNLLQTYWTNFAKTGDPNAAGLPNWLAWSDDKKEFLVINSDASVTTQRNFPPFLAHLEASALKQNVKVN